MANSRQTIRARARQGGICALPGFLLAHVAASPSHLLPSSPLPPPHTPRTHLESQGAATCSPPLSPTTFLCLCGPGNARGRGQLPGSRVRIRALTQPRFHLLTGLHTRTPNRCNFSPFFSRLPLPLIPGGSGRTSRVLLEPLMAATTAAAAMAPFLASPAADALRATVMAATLKAQTALVAAAVDALEAAVLLPAPLPLPPLRRQPSLPQTRTATSAMATISSTATATTADTAAAAAAVANAAAAAAPRRATTARARWTRDARRRWRASAGLSQTRWRLQDSQCNGTATGRPGCA
eukprot:58961-Chlamydomonas_euryale.AAC.1